MLDLGPADISCSSRKDLILEHTRGKSAQFTVIWHLKLSLYRSQGHHCVNSAQRNLEPGVLEHKREGKTAEVNENMAQEGKERN